LIGGRVNQSMMGARAIHDFNNSMILPTLGRISKI